MTVDPALSRLPLVLMLLVSWAPRPQATQTQETPTFSGRWSARAGESRIWHGRWIGQAIPGDPSSAHGSWTLTGARGRTLLTGTWSAQKRAKGWEGTWSAMTKTGRAAAGTWKADLPSDLKSTLRDLLELLSDEQVTGAWRSGRLSGTWWLKGKIRPASR